MMRIIFLILFLSIGASVSACNQPAVPVQISELNPDCVRRFIVRFSDNIPKHQVIAMLEKSETIVDDEKKFWATPLIVIEFPLEKDCSWINEKLKKLRSLPEIKKITPDIPSPPS